MTDLFEHRDHPNIARLAQSLKLNLSVSVQPMKVWGRVLEICFKNLDYYFPFKKLTSSLVVEVDFLEIIKGISSIAGKREQYISDNEVKNQYY